MLNTRRVRKFSSNMEQLVARNEAKKLGKLFVIAPLALSVLFYLFFPEDLRLVGVVIGITGGLLFPGFYIKFLTKKTKQKFQDQLVDSLMIMSSSFRGGLSLIQALEAVVEEMPDPINREFGTVLGENKMGVSLEEALNHLHNRMPSTAVQQMITAILLARETGGNLPAIFQRIVTNIRETKKIQQGLDTLTIQGKIQGVVLTMLPIGFFAITAGSNQKAFNNMISTDLGRGLLIYCFCSWAIGAFLVWKISAIKDF